MREPQVDNKSTTGSRMPRILKIKEACRLRFLFSVLGIEFAKTLVEHHYLDILMKRAVATACSMA